MKDIDDLEDLEFSDLFINSRFINKPYYFIIAIIITYFINKIIFVILTIFTAFYLFLYFMFNSLKKELLELRLQHNHAFSANEYLEDIRIKKDD